MQTGHRASGSPKIHPKQWGRPPGLPFGIEYEGRPTMRRLTCFLSLALPALAQTPCERLKSLSLPNTNITAAEARPAAANLPAHCRVAAVLTPSTDSHIEIEVWMPSSGWNGKFQAVGNGG